jgi:uncharacterized protein YndB with AHSA1/START domain
MNDASPRSVVFERDMPHSPEKIWRVLTERALIAGWLYENDFEPVVGHRFSFRGQPRPHWNGIIDSQVLAVEPNKRLSYNWNSSGEDAAAGLKTVVTWTLTPGTAGGTHVRMEQSGFRSEEESKGASYGWDRLLNNLERVASGLS